MDVPSGLGERGSLLWQSLTAGVTDVARIALVTESARIADRLDELDSIIQGKGVLNLMQFRVLDREVDDDGSVNISVEVKFNAVLAEARQQATAFSAILSKLGLEGAAAAAPVEAPKTGKDMLEQRRRERATRSG